MVKVELAPEGCLQHRGGEPSLSLGVTCQKCLQAVDYGKAHTWQGVPEEGPQAWHQLLQGR